jgi:hypothetical protein
LELRGHSERSLAAELAGFGALLEVLDPLEVRAHLHHIGAELVTMYSDAGISATLSRSGR